MKAFIIIALMSWLAVGVEWAVPEFRYRFADNVTVKYADPGTPFPQSQIEAALRHHGLTYGECELRWNWEDKEYEFKRDGQWISLMNYQLARKGVK